MISVADSVRTRTARRAGLLAGLVLLLATACSRPPEPVTIGGPTMGTQWSVRLAEPPPALGVSQLRAEIEDALIRHPAVAAAGVIGKPDPLRTEIVVAYVVLRDGFAASAALAKELQDHARTRCAAHSYPREVVFLTALPMTVTGKVMRRELRKLAATDAAPSNDTPLPEPAA